MSTDYDAPYKLRQAALRKRPLLLLASSAELSEYQKANGESKVTAANRDADRQASARKKGRVA